MFVRQTNAAILEMFVRQTNVASSKMFVRQTNAVNQKCLSDKQVMQLKNVCLTKK